MSIKTIYFPGLNGIRFFAAFLVVIDHLELFKGYFGLKTNWSESFSAHLGSTGVTIFFVLSGFLITFLLLKEKEAKKLNISYFYMRRILRIWPLYYLIIALSFFIIPHIDFLSFPNYGVKLDSYFNLSFFVYFFLLANIAFVYLPTVAFSSILWSVAVEEQFYLIWPIIIKRFNNTLKVLLFILVFYFTLKLFASIDALGIKSYLPNKFSFLIDRTRISCMIIGGIGAFSVINFQYYVNKWVFSIYTQLISIICFILILFNLIQLPFYALLKNELLSFIIILILINVSTNRKSILNLEKRIFDYLGKISYGIYVYHLFAVVICIKVSSFYNLPKLLPNYILSIILLMSVTLITILISHFSYHYFEKIFLKKKQNYSIILTKDFTEYKN